MERKAIMGIAAVAGIGLLLYLRKSGDSSTLAGATSLLNSAGGATSWASQPIVITTNTKAPAVVDNSAATPAPTTNTKAPAVYNDTSAAGWGPGAPASKPASSGGGYLDEKTGIYHFSDGSTYQNPFNYGTPEKPQWALTGKEVAGFWM